MNPFDVIDRMPGTDFLIFYVVIAVLTLFATHLALELMDPTADLDLPHVPSQPDPHRFAYLRGGDNELARLAILELVDHGYLAIEEKKRFLQSTQQLLVRGKEPEMDMLTPFARLAWRWFIEPRQAREIFAEKLPGELEGASQAFKTALEDERLLNNPVQVAARSLKAGVIAGAFLSTLALFKLYTAIEEGRENITLLLIAGAVSLALLWGVCQPERLSQLGKEYIKAVQLAYESLKPGVRQAHPVHSQLEPEYAFGWGPASSISVVAAVEPARYLLAAGLFGYAALEGTQHEGLRSMFGRSAGNGGCGAGCGSCGGCGGCGGCGCG